MYSTLRPTSGNIIVWSDEPSSGQYWWHLTWSFSITLFNISTALEFCSHTISQKCPAVFGKGPWVNIYCLWACSNCKIPQIFSSIKSIGPKIKIHAFCKKLHHFNFHFSHDTEIHFQLLEKNIFDRVSRKQDFTIYYFFFDLLTLIRFALI